MRNGRSEEIFRYWDSLRLGQAAPARTQINPVAMRTCLSDLFILDHEGGDFKFRLAGTHICDAFDRELRGHPFAVMWNASSGSIADRVARLALRIERPVLLDLSIAGASAYPAFEALLLPLRSPQGHADRLLGSLLPLGRVPAHRPLSVGAFALDHWQTIDGGAPMASAMSAAAYALTGPVQSPGGAPEIFSPREFIRPDPLSQP